MKIIASYYLYSEFILPKGVELLSKEDNQIDKWGKPGSWSIKWDILTYFDRDGKEHKLRPISECTEGHDYKRPDDIVIEEWDEEEDEEKED